MGLHQGSIVKRHVRAVVVKHCIVDVNDCSKGSHNECVKRKSEYGDSSFPDTKIYIRE